MDQRRRMRFSNGMQGPRPRAFPAPAFSPQDYARWRASRLGALAERLESRAVFDLLGGISGRRVLDVGCGDGSYAARAAAQGAFAAGVDLSAPMLKAASLRGGVTCGSSCWVQGSAEALPFPSAAFDAVLAVTLLCFVTSPERAVREMARVLRPGGVLVLGELGRYSLWALSRRVRGRLGSKLWRSARFWSERSLRRLAEEAGLRCEASRGAAYYPPVPFLVDILSVLDAPLSRLTRYGAAFVALRAVKP